MPQWIGLAGWRSHDQLRRPELFDQLLEHIHVFRGLVLVSVVDIVLVVSWTSLQES